jgi:hypothetical protein
MVGERVTTPLFLTLLAVHIPAGLIAVAAGAATALTDKTSPRHARLGRAYAYSLVVVAATAAVLAVLVWPNDVHLLALDAVAVAAAGVGVTARRRRWPGDTVHIVAMGTSYIALLTAFYVDNGPHLPLWNRLPTLAFWIGPAMLGVPLIARGVWRRRAT